MPKIREEDVISVHAEFFTHPETLEKYPISWHVRVKGGARTFESYGERATDFPYPVTKLPKAVQSFLETATAGKPLRNGRKESILYT